MFQKVLSLGFEIQQIVRGVGSNSNLDLSLRDSHVVDHFLQLDVLDDDSDDELHQKVHADHPGGGTGEKDSAHQEIGGADCRNGMQRPNLNFKCLLSYM